MALVALLIDSSTGALVDVVGNNRENARYAKFAKRMLSLDKNPTLNYGANGGNVLTISQNGGSSSGSAIRLIAETISVLGTLKDKNGKTIDQVVSAQVATALDALKGKSGEIKVSSTTDASTGKTTVTVSLDPSIMTKINAAIDSATGQASKFSEYISKSELLDALDGITFEDEDDLDVVKAKLGLLVTRLTELSDGASSPDESE